MNRLQSQRDNEGQVEDDNISLLPLIDGHMAERPQPIAFESAGPVALSDNRYKLIHVPERPRNAADVPTESLRFELYDLLADPGETNDLAAAHPAIVRGMAAKLAEWRESCAASLAGRQARPPGVD